MALGRGCQTRYKLQDLYQEHRYVGVLHFQKVLLKKILHRKLLLTTPPGTGVPCHYCMA